MTFPSQINYVVFLPILFQQRGFQKEKSTEKANHRKYRKFHVPKQGRRKKGLKKTRQRLSKVVPVGVVAPLSEILPPSTAVKTTFAPLRASPAAGQGDSRVAPVGAIAPFVAILPPSITDKTAVVSLGASPAADTSPSPAANESSAPSADQSSGIK